MKTHSDVIRLVNNMREDTRAIMEQDLAAVGQCWTKVGFKQFARIDGALHVKARFGRGEYWLDVDMVQAVALAANMGVLRSRSAGRLVRNEMTVVPRS